MGNSNPPLIETLAFDPILSSCKLIAEAWDAGGLYRVGTFPAFGRSGEWNGKYRDCSRKFLKGDSGQIGEIAQRRQGSPDIYKQTGRTPATSINFITCHDGFTLAELVSFNQKHNEANGENNNDGNNDNLSWNCGAEGWSDDSNIKELRQKKIMNAMALLLASRGVPMILMGDEVGRSQHGNNNAYCLDSPISWLDWKLIDSNQNLLDFTKALIHFRLKHPTLRVNSYDSANTNSTNIPICGFHGASPWKPNWDEDSRQLAWMMTSETGINNDDADIVYLAANMAHYASWYELPQISPSFQWMLKFNTGDINCHYHPLGKSLTENGILVRERSIVIFTASKVNSESTV